MKKNNLPVSIFLFAMFVIFCPARVQAFDYSHEKDAISIILNEAPGSFFEGHAIDEGFLTWLIGETGSDAVNDIAYCVYQGNFDSGIWQEYTGYRLDNLWIKYCHAISYDTKNLSNIIFCDEPTDEFTMDFIGDICFDDEWYTMKKANARTFGVEACISENVRSELKSADITMVNNEFTYCDDGTALEGKAYTFKADTKSVVDLEVFGTDIVSLANNHVYDYGEDGLLKTLDTLKAIGMPYVGAGQNLSEASAVKYIFTGKYKVAVVSATAIEKYAAYTRAASENEPGVFKTNNAQYLYDVIQQAKNESDYVVAYIHWGNEGDIKYESDQQKLAEFIIEAGADCIIGGHPHRLQGVGYIQGKPVLYSLGNFWFSTGSLYTAIAQIKINDDGRMSVGMIPCVQKNLTTSMITDADERAEFFKYIADISSYAGITEDGIFGELSDDENKDDYEYRTGQSYEVHNESIDLDGNEIDSIGNIIKN